MKQHRLSTKAATLFIAIIGALLLVPCIIIAGQLQPAALLQPRLKPLDKVQPTWSQKLPAVKRFVLVLDGEAVLDKETGLVWEKSPDTTTKSWNDAVDYCYTKVVGGRMGWRLPTVEELASLVDTTQTNPALPSGHPFQNVQSSFYWSATTSSRFTNAAWFVYIGDGVVNVTSKPFDFFVWCVRGGHGYDAY
jgi:hypothetical protein